MHASTYLAQGRPVATMLRKGHDREEGAVFYGLVVLHGDVVVAVGCRRVRSQANYPVRCLSGVERVNGNHTNRTNRINKETRSENDGA